VNILVIILALLAAGSGTVAVKQHKQLAAAHVAAVSAQAENAQAKTAIADLVAAESTQRAAQAKEDAARAAQEGDRTKRGQIVQVYIGATGQALKQVPPAVDNAAKFNSLAAGAADPPTPETQAAALALAQATEAQQAQRIADLQAELDRVRADDSAKAVVIAAQVKDKIEATGKIAELTGTVAVHVEKEGAQDAVIAQVTDQSNSRLAKIAVLTAYASKYIGAIVCLALLAIGGFWLWHVERIHHSYTKAGLLKSINPPAP